MKHVTVFLFVMAATAPAGAANICNETVPSNRIIDGIPAYQQCTDSTNAAIYSNNGVDTATSSGGSDWARTQYSGGYQCTELAHRYLYFKWGIKNVPNGNAGVWCDGTIPTGLQKSTAPVHGDLIVFAPGSCGADTTTGHVAVVDVVNSNATVTFIEQNRAGRRSCANDTAACFLHAIANDGTQRDGGTVDGPAPDSGSTVEPDAGARPDRPADHQRSDVPGSGGVAGMGGATGSGGGSGGTGGDPSGSGGARASGGTTGSGSQTAIGSGGATSSTSQTPSSSSSGCSCRVTDGRATGGSAGIAFLLMLFVALALARRPKH